MKLPYIGGNFLHESGDVDNIEKSLYLIRFLDPNVSSISTIYNAKKVDNCF